MIHNFSDYLTWSKGALGPEDKLTIKAMLPGCVTVEPSSELLDKAGVDYVAQLRKGAQVLVDCKTRRIGCSRFWKTGPELALESWSVAPNGKYRTPETRAKTGWTLCEHKTVDLILFKFDPEDSRDVFLVCFQLLRVAFKRNFSTWKSSFKCDTQDNGNFESQAVFVPAETVLKAIDECSRGKLQAERGQLQAARAAG